MVYVCAHACRASMRPRSHIAGYILPMLCAASYAFGSETSTDVTAGFARITSAAQCERGARALGGSIYRGNLSRADAPLGCFFDKGTNSSWFNTASSSNVQYTIRKVMAASFVPCPTCASKAQA